MIKVFTGNERGNIELTPTELENLLTEAYREGQKNSNVVYWPKTTYRTDFNPDANSILYDKAPYDTDISSPNDVKEEQTKLIGDIFSNLKKELNL